jgi:erlin
VSVQIVACRVTKPRIPRSLLSDYERMEGEKTKLLITTQHQRVIEKEAETERMRAMIAAEKQAEVSKIQSEKELTEKLAFQRVQAIEDRMYSAKQKALADAQFYKQQKLAEANQLKLTYGSTRTPQCTPHRCRQHAVLSLHCTQGRPAADSISSSPSTVSQ